MSNKKSNLNEIYNQFIEKQIYEKTEKLNLKNINEYLAKNENLEEDSYEIVGKIAELESLYEKKKKFLQNIKKDELDRIAKEFLTNDYERRFNVNKKTMVSAIVGEDNTETEIIRQTREEKVLNLFKFL